VCTFIMNWWVIFMPVSDEVFQKDAGDNSENRLVIRFVVNLLFFTRLASQIPNLKH